MTRKALLITGSAQGIGAAITEHFLQKGHTVYGVDKRYSEQRFTSRQNRFFARHCDLADATSLESVLLELKQFNGIDIVINNAGYGGPFHRIDEVSDDEWDLLFSVNVRALFQISRALLPLMKAKGQGRIINIASIQAMFGAPSSSTYVACKHAVLGYTRAIAAEWAGFGISCNAISPGYVDTAMGIQENGVSNHFDKVIGLTPTASIAAPEDIAKVAYFLGVEAPSYVNGANWVVDGGISSSII